MAYGFVYVLNNHLMPNIYKIGFTDKSPMQRCEDLSSKTAVPQPYNLVCYCELWHPASLEHHLHTVYKDKRINKNREFFELTDEDIFEIRNIMKSKSNHFMCCQELDIILTIHLNKGDEYGMV